MKSELKLTAAALAEKAAQAAEAAARAQAAALAAGAEFDAEAEVRRQAFMKKWLAEEFVQAHEADVVCRATLAAFETAVQNDPLMQVWLAHLRANFRTSVDGQTAANFAQQTGVPAPRYDPHASTEPFFGAMNRAMERLASRLEAERTADIFDALEAAANGEGDV